MIDFEKECGLKIVKDLVKVDKTISRIYGFILYTDKDPYVAKVLSDRFYWNALDSISGSHWPIFAVRPLSRGRAMFPNFRKDSIGYMVPTWNEPNSNLRILHDFGIQDSQELPLFILFMWDDEDNLNEISIPIVGNDETTVYRSLEDIVKAVSRVEADILPEYKNSVTVFRNVKAELDAIKFQHAAYTKVTALKRLFDFIRSFG
jgi:hypothetical protein